jgi:hypothetical protein
MLAFNICIKNYDRDSFSSFSKTEWDSHVTDIVWSV